MAKALVIDLEKCVGCRTCEMVCSAIHEGVINPFRSRIKVDYLGQGVGRGSYGLCPVRGSPV